MPTSVRKDTRRLLVGLTPLIVALAALPLLAPTCGNQSSAGNKVFSRLSLIIPMDRCYQYQTDVRTGTGQPTGCPLPTAAAGNVTEAYGLVYQLIRNGVAVYWVINPTKTTLQGEDFHIQYNGGVPAYLYNWSTGSLGAAASPGSTIVSYKGGPFVVDGSDFAKASAILQQFSATFSGVNVHVSNVAFTAYVAKTMAGGWSAGGTTPPKLALLNIGSGNLTQISPPIISDPKNSEEVIQGYLAAAGIGSGSAGGSATGTHGQIFDALGIQDFQPGTSGDWTTSNFGLNNYQILWVPHWTSAGSCADPSSTDSCANTLYPASQTNAVLQAVSSFVTGGGDLFIECAGIGAFEGAFQGGSNTNYTTDYPNHPTINPSTHFQTLTGERYNEVNIGQAIAVPPGQFGSPLMQLGDFPFVPVTGAIQITRPGDASAGGGYQSNTIRLFSPTGSNTNWDYYTVRPKDTTHGTIVYLSGHSYSGVDGEFQIGGSRLVLNTLFDLGASCVESGITCDTGLLGVCSVGQMQCVNGQPTCVQVVQPSPEVCNGLDDNCNGLVDEGLETSCYTGPAGTEGVGLCRAGVSQCVQNPTTGVYGMSGCIGEVLPQPEVCNGLDDNCNGQVDENLTQSCYQGPLSTINATTGLPQGTCKEGTQTCTVGNWGPCVGQVLPATQDQCTPPEDNMCNGIAGVGCTCTLNASLPCYDGPAGTEGVGTCLGGTRTCVALAGGSTGWGPCVGEVLPKHLVCNTLDDQNCSGTPPPASCNLCAAGQTKPCYTGPAGTEGVGICVGGTESCVNGSFSGSCLGEVTPAPVEVCDGLDNDCNGIVDDGAACESGFYCDLGVCVPSSCGVEQPCPEGYDCATTGCPTGQTSCCAQKTASACTNEVCVGGCRDGESCAAATDCDCAPGLACAYGACVNPCQGVVCGVGSTCASGACVAGACYFTGCPSGQLCQSGACTADPCQGVSCPSGTFCREGNCVQACAFVTCASGETCGPDGFCQPDPCASVTCNAGQVCSGGTCTTNICLGVGCAVGQVCQASTCSGVPCEVCVDDPCAGITCPTGSCVNGQCYALPDTTSLTPTPSPSPPSNSGCGYGGGGGLGALLSLVAVMAFPLARHRRRNGLGLVVLWLAGTALLVSCKKTSSAAPFNPANCAHSCLGENQCIDFNSDPTHCGGCGQTCSAGDQCVDGVCGPTELVAPEIDSLDPTTAGNGGTAPVTITLTGARFQNGAQLHVASVDSNSTLATTLVSATQVTADLNLENVTPGNLALRIVNPDNVISNAITFTVSLPAPVVTGVTTATGPSSPIAGTVTILVVTGTGLGANSQCVVQAQGVTAFTLPTTPVTPATNPPSLDCTLDATILVPGSYQISVVNYGAATSSPFNFTLAAASPVLSDVSPSVGLSGTDIAVTLVGSGFNPASTAYFDCPSVCTALGTEYIDANQLFVAELPLPACSGTSCQHNIEVQNGPGLVSAPMTIVAGSQPPQVTSLSPGTGYQGTTVTVTFTGSQLQAGSVVQAAPHSGTFATVTSSSTPGCPGTCTSVQGVINLVGQPSGSWQLRVLFPDGTTSSSFPFTVLSNQAILVNASPLGGAQGASPTVTLTVSNLQQPLIGVTVLFNGQTIVPTSTTLTSGSTGTVTATLSLVGSATGSFPLEVVNPNSAQPSNAVEFTVFPGPPTLNPAVPPSPASAAYSDTPVVITLTGTNFAAPSTACGTGGSTVYIGQNTLGFYDTGCPPAGTATCQPIAIPVCENGSQVTTVVSPTEMQISFDTRNAVAGYPYDVMVWNPGLPGTSVPQVSNVLQGAFTVTE